MTKSSRVKVQNIRTFLLVLHIIMDTTDLTVESTNELSSEQIRIKDKILKAQKAFEKLVREDIEKKLTTEDIERQLKTASMLWKQCREMFDRRRTLILEMEKRIGEAELGIKRGNELLENTMVSKYKRRQKIWTVFAICVVCGIVGLVLKLVL